MVTLYQDIYATNGTQTVFNFEYQIINGEDVIVYFNPVAGSPVSNTDFTDSMIVTNYTVTVSTLPTIGGSITFPTPPANGGALLLRRNIADDLSSDFANPGTLNGAALDSLFLRIKLLFQQLGFDADQFALHYDRLAPISPDMITVVSTLQQNQSWIRVGDTIVGVTIGDDPGAAVLRADLASESEGHDGALLVGYYDTSTASGKTVKAKLDEISEGFTKIGTRVFSDVAADYTTPEGQWFLEDHRAISRTTWAAYFALVGTRYGTGDGTTTFNLFGGNVFLMAAGTTYPVNTTGGNAEITQAGNQVGKHTHAHHWTDLDGDPLPDPGAPVMNIGATAGDTYGGGSDGNSGLLVIEDSADPVSMNIINPYRAMNSFIFVGKPAA